MKGGERRDCPAHGLVACGEAGDVRLGLAGLSMACPGGAGFCTAGWVRLGRAR